MTEAAGRKALLDWYRANSQDLPWRGERDPYRVLVSEVMLQQTQAGRVVAYYREFVERFPTTAALAAAPFSDVVEVWSGLGYYTRARRLQEAAPPFLPPANGSERRPCGPLGSSFGTAGGAHGGVAQQLQGTPQGFPTPQAFPPTPGSS